MDSPSYAETNGVGLNTLSWSNRIFVLAPLGYYRFQKNGRQSIRFSKMNRSMYNIVLYILRRPRKKRVNHFWQGKNEESGCLQQNSYFCPVKNDFSRFSRDLRRLYPTIYTWIDSPCRTGSTDVNFSGICCSLGALE